MIARYTFVGLLAAMMTGPMAGRAGADGGFRILDLKPIVNMDWRDEVWGDGKGGWTDQGDNDMRQISVGTRQLAGRSFRADRPGPQRRQGRAHAGLEEVSRRSARGHGPPWAARPAALFPPRRGVVRRPHGDLRRPLCRRRHGGDPHPRQGGDHELVVADTRAEVPRGDPRAQRPDRRRGPGRLRLGQPASGQSHSRHRAEKPQRRRDRRGGGDHGLGQARAAARPQRHPHARILAERPADVGPLAVVPGRGGRGQVPADADRPVGLVGRPGGQARFHEDRRRPLGLRGRRAGPPGGHDAGHAARQEGIGSTWPAGWPSTVSTWCGSATW